MHGGSDLTIAPTALAQVVLAITPLTLSIPGRQVPDFTEEKNRSPEKGFDLLKVTQPPKVISPRVCVFFFSEFVFNR